MVSELLEANQNSYRYIMPRRLPNAQTNLKILRAFARALINIRAGFFCLRISILVPNKSSGMARVVVYCTGL